MCGKLNRNSDDGKSSFFEDETLAGFVDLEHQIIDYDGAAGEGTR